MSEGKRLVVCTAIVRVADNPEETCLEATAGAQSPVMELV